MLSSVARKMIVGFDQSARTSGVLALLSLAGWVCGCGGKVVFDTDGGGGSGSSAFVAATVGVSTTGVTHAAVTTGTTSACPKEDPIVGSSCDSPGLICSLPNQCCNPSARCENGTWHISAVDCASICIPCGPSIECADNAVCVTTQVDANVLHRCDANPCTTEPLDCNCAGGPLCGQAAQCLSAGGSQVSCATLTD